MPHSIIITFFFNWFFCFASFGQCDTDKQLQNSKGTLLYPVSKYKKIEDINYRRSEYVFDSKDSSVTFICDNASEVRASFNGKVVMITKNEMDWSLTIRNGNYFIAYVGLTKPNISIGDDVSRGQFIAYLSKGADEVEYQLGFFLFRLHESMDPLPWLQKN